MFGSELPALQPEALQRYAAAQDAARSAAPPAAAARAPAAPVLSIRRMKADISRAGLSRRGCWTREEVEARHRQAVARLEGREEPDELDLFRDGANQDILARVAAGESCEWDMTFFASLSSEFGDEWLENKIAGDEGIPVPGPLMALGRTYKAKFENPPGGSHDRLILKLKRRHCSYCHQVSGPSGPSLPHCSAPERNTRRRSRAQNAAVAGLGRTATAPPRTRGPAENASSPEAPRPRSRRRRGVPRGYSAGMGGPGARRAERRAASKEARGEPRGARGGLVRRHRRTTSLPAQATPAAPAAQGTATKRVSASRGREGTNASAPRLRRGGGGACVARGFRTRRSPSTTRPVGMPSMASPSRAGTSSA